MFVFIISIVALIICVIENRGNNPHMYDYDKRDARLLSKLITMLSVLSVFSALLIIAVPSENAVYKIIGIKASKQVVSEVQNSERFNKVLKVIDIKLDEMVEK